MQSLKRQLTFLWIVIPLAWFTLGPMDIGYFAQSGKDVTLTTENIGLENPGAFFRQRGGGKYLVQAGHNKPVKATFQFLKKASVLIVLVGTGQGTGSIKLTVKQNGKNVFEDNVHPGSKRQVDLQAVTGDLVEITGARPTLDHEIQGLISIRLQSTNFLVEVLLIPFLWVMLSLLLIQFNQFFSIFALYSVFIILMAAEQAVFGAVGIHSALAYTYLCFLAVVFNLGICLALPNKDFWNPLRIIIMQIMAVSVYAVPLLILTYTLNFESSISAETLYAVFQTNLRESIDFIVEFSKLKWILFFFFSFGFIGFLLIKQQAVKIERVDRKLLIFVPIFLIFLFQIPLLVTDKQPTTNDFRLYDYIFKERGRYQKELSLFRSEQEKRRASNEKFSATRSIDIGTHIVVIGESLDKSHMSLYGYMRNTNPLLSELRSDPGFITFNNAFSNHTHTVEALSLALTEANQLNNKNYYESLSILNVLRQAGVESHWISNQSLYSEWDNLVSVLANEADNLITLNYSIGKHTRSQSLDEVVINEVELILSQLDDTSKVIFVHLSGSHWSYCSRFPQEYSVFQGALHPGYFGLVLSENKQLARNINCYDNSVLYNDFVVASLLKALKSKNDISSLIYLSDHPEDVFSEYGHNSDKFDIPMTQIPLLMWFSEAYRLTYTEKFHALNQNSEALFGNDFLYDSLIGIMDLHTDRYNPQHDLSSNKYQLLEEDAFTLHGQVLYTANSNYLYHLAKNSAELRHLDSQFTVMPANVNSIGKAHDARSNGFRSIQLDVLVTKDGELQLANQSHPSGLDLNELIEVISTHDKFSVLVHLKNLRKDNLKSVLNDLDNLNKRFGLKNRLIIESSVQDGSLRSLGEAGWETAYILPSAKIEKLMRGENHSGAKQLAKSITVSVNRESATGISFTNEDYSFVRLHLSDLIPPETGFYLHDKTLELSQSGFLQELETNNYQNDERIKFIIVKYRSVFDL